MSSNAGKSTGAPDTFERELRRAASLLEQGRFEQAYTWAAEALALRPAHLLAQNLLGLILYQQHRFIPALDIFENLVRKNPDVITLRMNAGLAALQAGQLNRALEHLRRAVDLDAGHRRAFTALAVAHLRGGEIHLAAAALLEAGLESMAAQLGEPVQLEAVRQLEADLCLLAEELPPGAQVSPCEGFAEVTALVPLDGWRQAELAAGAESDSAVMGPNTDELLGEERARLEQAPPRLAAPICLGPILTGGAPEPATPSPVPPVAGGGTAAPTPGAVPALAGSAAGEARAELPPSPMAPAQPAEVSLVAAWPEEAAPLAEESLFAAAPEQAEPPREPAAADAEAAGLPIPPPLPEGRTPRPLAAGLAALALPLEGPPALLWEEALLLRLRPDLRGVLLRPDRVILEAGELERRRASRQRKGAEAGPFLVEGQALEVVRGEGLLLLRGPRPYRLTLLHLEEEAIFVMEPALLAASAELHWENGRLPGVSEESLRLVHVRGSGFLALCSAERAVTLAVGEEQSARIQLEHLLGWSGGVVPQPDQEGTVGFSGAGVVLLHL